MGLEKRSQKRKRRQFERAVRADGHLIRTANRKLKKQTKKAVKRSVYGPAGRPAPLIIRYVEEPDEIVSVRKSGRLSSEYDRYLRSAAWRRLRDQVLIRDRHRCVWCGYRSKLQVHHKTYERVMCEDLDDLVTLCEICHSRFHREQRKAVA